MADIKQANAFAADPRSSIFFRTGAQQGARYASGPVVYDEAFQAGRLVTRYWNPNGQVWPEMHYARLTWGPDEPADSFQLAINGRNLAGGFDWVSATLEPDRSRWRARRGPDGAGSPATLPVVHGVIRLTHREAGVDVAVHTRLDGSPFVIRWLEITNRNQQPVAISAVAPFSGLL